MQHGWTGLVHGRRRTWQADDGWLVVGECGEVCAHSAHNLDPGLRLLWQGLQHPALRCLCGEPSRLYLSRVREELPAAHTSMLEACPHCAVVQWRGRVMVRAVHVVDKASREVWGAKACTPVNVTVLLVQKLCTMCMAPQLAFSKELRRVCLR